MLLGSEGGGADAFGYDGFDLDDNTGGLWSHWKRRQQIIMNVGL